MSRCTWVCQEPVPLFLAGPTAVGKSAIAMALAPKVHGEIISVDSMQVYRGLEVGTSKPTPTDRRKVRHHLLDVAEIGESYNAGRFAEEATRIAQEVQSRGHVPILSGGSGLYFQALLEGVGSPIPSSPEARGTLERLSLPELLGELERRDPERFRVIDQMNRRRVTRALEIARATGQSSLIAQSSWRRRGAKEQGEGVRDEPIFFAALRRTREDLQARIARRVDWMFEAGLVAETKVLLQGSLPPAHGARQAIGYKQVLEHLRGAYSLEETIERVKQRTRQYAKRQMNWFRNEPSIEWLEAPVSLEKLLERLRQRSSAV